MIGAGFLAGLALGASAAAAAPDAPEDGCETSFSLEVMRREPGFRPDEDRELARALVDHGACLAAADGGGKACRVLRPFALNDDDLPTLEAACLSHAHFLRFARRAAGGRGRAALPDCRRWLAPEAAGRRYRSLDAACEALARAYGPGYYPACEKLSSPPIVAEGADRMDVERSCRLDLYPVYGCADAGHSLDLAACEAFAAEVAAIRKGEGDEWCAAARRRAARGYCRRAREPGRSR
ncbi:MAG: hypothetical protein HYV14_04625 [Elusimicrobia bacterium]|nr:hypothetical protein [Elusimicrobiota bacterium]